MVTQTQQVSTFESLRRNCQVKRTNRFGAAKEPSLLLVLEVSDPGPDSLAVVRQPVTERREERSLALEMIVELAILEGFHADGGIIAAAGGESRLARRSFVADDLQVGDDFLVDQNIVPVYVEALRRGRLHAI